MLEDLQGWATRSQTRTITKTRTELIIFIRPQIIRDSMDAHTVAEELRTKLRGTVSASSPHARQPFNRQHYWRLRWPSPASPALTASPAERIYDRGGGEPIVVTRGSARALGRLGFRYENGFGVPQNYIAAADLYLRAAEQGDPFAQSRLGLSYDKGHGVPKDFILSYKWLDSRDREGVMA